MSEEIRRNPKIEIWAHRGASAYEPENTMKSFQLAVKQCADGIELDVQLSADGEVVVAHDERLERVSDGTGYVKDYTLEELKKLNFNRTHPECERALLPTLSEVLEFLKDTDIKLNIELKTGVFFYNSIEEKVLDLVAEYGMDSRVWYSSFNHYSIKRIKQLNPQAKTGILYSDGIYEPAEYACNLGADAIHPHYKNLQYERVSEQCKKKGLRIHTWTVDGYQELFECVNAGVDAVITNRPDTTRLLLERLSLGECVWDNPFRENVKRREFYLFGAGVLGQQFIKQYGNHYLPKAVLDNAPEKWGSMLTVDETHAVCIESPQQMKKDACVVIASIHYLEMIRQLQELGITDYYIYHDQCKW